MDPIQPQNPSQGPVIGIIIVIIVLIVGAFYFFTRISEIQNAEPVATTTTEIDFATTSSSDDTAAIESDLEAEDFDDIDAEMGALQGEFGY